MNNWWSWFKSAFFYTCPQCREDTLFVSPLDIAKPLEMKPACSNCQLDYEPEPGFYYGAMFLSYAIDGVTLLPLSLILIFLFSVTLMKVLIIIITLKIVLLFWLLRFSRSLWLHIYIRYTPKN